MIQPERVPGLIADLAPYVAVACECQVIDFSKRAGYGPYLKTRMPDAELLNGFESGQRYHMLLIRIMEDDMPATANPEDRKPYKTSQLAGMMCADEQFRHFITATYGEVCHNKDQAAEWVRQACGVESRSLLDVDETAAQTFRVILQAFDEWKKAGDDGG